MGTSFLVVDPLRLPLAALRIIVRGRRLERAVVVYVRGVVSATLNVRQEGGGMASGMLGQHR